MFKSNILRIFNSSFKPIYLCRFSNYSTLVKDQDANDSIFKKMLDGDIPCNKVFEDDKCLAFNDIQPQAPIHVLIIPKIPIGGISSLKKEESSYVGHLFVAAKQIAENLKISDKGYRTVINEGKHGQQTVRWLHLHLLGGRQLKWPPG